MRYCLLLMLICITGVSSNTANAEIEFFEEFTAICGLFTPEGTNPSLPSSSTPDVYIVPIPLAYPGMTGNDPTFGNFVRRTGDDGRWASCRSSSEPTATRYNYDISSVAENWYHEMPRKDDPSVNYNFTQSDNKVFWDWYYRDYNGPAQCDYSQNCHGFAFGGGDWPHTANGPMGFAFMLDPCYKVTTKKDATVASDLAGHSIQVIGERCLPDLPGVECVTAPPLGGGDVEDDPCEIETIVYSAEQFRESGTYTRSEDCEDGGLGVKLAHTRAGNILSMFGGFNNVKFYKFDSGGDDSDGGSGGCCGSTGGGL